LEDFVKKYTPEDMGPIIEVRNKQLEQQ
jgi:hypothetical protein